MMTKKDRDFITVNISRLSEKGLWLLEESQRKGFYTAKEREKYSEEASESFRAAASWFNSIEE